MKAAVLEKFGQSLNVTDLPEPDAGPGEVVIRVRACGVCHSDLHLAEADWAQLKPITKLPLVLGHEIAGTVSAVGTEVHGLAVGDRVGVPWLHWTCGECEYCKAGRETLCGKQMITGVTVDGGYAEFVKAKASHVTRLPDDVSFEQAAPLMCAGLTVYKALKISGLESMERLAVFGIGGLGHIAVQLGKARGAEVIALDVAQDKLALARECGADHVIDVSAGPPRKAVRALGGAHVAMVCSGSAAAYEAALGCLRKGGTLVVVGMPAEPIPMSAVALVAGELRVVASAVGTREDLRELMEIAATGAVRVKVETRGLEAAQAALDEMKSGGLTGRVVLKP